MFADFSHLVYSPDGHDRSPSLKPAAHPCPKACHLLGYMWASVDYSHLLAKRAIWGSGPIEQMCAGPEVPGNPVEAFLEPSWGLLGPVTPT